MTARHVVGRQVKKPRICRAIRQARLGSDLSVGELSRRMGVAQSTMSRWESFIEPSLSVINEIERQLRLGKGDILRAAGFVDSEFVSVRRAVEGDPSLDDRGRRTVLATYRAQLNGHRP